MPSPISDALSTLSDRGLRRLLGARTFLRGLDYARRRVVEDVQVAEASAQGRVKGSDSDPYTVRVDLTPDTYVYVFSVADGGAPLAIAFEVEPRRYWRSRGTIGLADGEPLPITQFIYP